VALCNGRNLFDQLGFQPVSLATVRFATRRKTGQRTPPYALPDEQQAKLLHRNKLSDILVNPHLLNRGEVRLDFVDCGPRLREFQQDAMDIVVPTIFDPEHSALAHAYRFKSGKSTTHDLLASSLHPSSISRLTNAPVIDSSDNEDTSRPLTISKQKFRGTGLRDRVDSAFLDFLVRCVG
jgi:hypothetical protein